MIWSRDPVLMTRLAAAFSALWRGRSVVCGWPAILFATSSQATRLIMPKSVELKETGTRNTVDIMCHCQLGIKIYTKITHHFYWRYDVTATDTVMFIVDIFRMLATLLNRTIVWFSVHSTAIVERHTSREPRECIRRDAHVLCRYQWQ